MRTPNARFANLPLQEWGEDIGKEVLKKWQ